ncbi:hypothetical protein BO78DRAFT_193270 [Aspergillus sclerotiicarbonarius CBS 121057]|uniref:Uncharacterized protein n=1 Tax=Aspergillus sclerotiicarbonarius (strain CBS 121057 / IBT 28362) TaxID=1448318 RepID=A0A319E0W8_ASPSB|nr:hypothetical protein BO78DRAFT_193270 [Aspergillus sclerotiicarbonarius CBS 121057]
MPRKSLAMFLGLGGLAASISLGLRSMFGTFLILQAWHCYLLLFRVPSRYRHWWPYILLTSISSPKSVSSESFPPSQISSMGPLTWLINEKQMSINSMAMSLKHVT